MPAEKPPFAIRTVVILAVGGWVLWGLFTLLVAYGFAQNNEMAVAGQIGDLFGGINALFSALAFAMVWWSGDMQRRELSLQRQDLQLQLEELRAQRDELAETRSVFKRQNFETAFFQQLTFMRDMIPSFRVGNSEGEAALGSISRACDGILRGENADVDQISSNIYYKNFISENYEKYIHARYENQIGPYFRTLYHAFKLVDAQDFSREDKIQYANLIRAQLGSNVLIILAANVMSPPGDGFRDLIKRYGVLKHFPRRPYINRLVEIFPSGAFSSARLD